MSEVLQKVVLGLLFFSLVIFAFHNSFGVLANQYDYTPTDDFNETFNRINKTINLTRQVADSIDKSEKETTLDVVDSLFKNSFSALLLLWESFSLADATIDDVMSDIGFDPIFIGVLQAALLIVTLVSIMLLILRRA